MAGRVEDGQFVVEVDGPPDRVRARLRRGLLPVRSVWFPTLAELRAWDGSAAPLYLREPRGRLEVGPRLVNIQAARFCPVLDVTLEPVAADRTRLAGRVRFPTFATMLVATWTVALALWLAVEVMRPDPDHGWGFLFWWGLLAAALVAGVGVGIVAGGRALRDALPELVRVADDPEAGGEDWA